MAAPLIVRLIIPRLSAKIFIPSRGPDELDEGLCLNEAHPACERPAYRAASHLLRILEMLGRIELVDVDHSILMCGILEK